MAVTIKQKPQYDPTSAYGRLPYYISGSTNLSEPQHQYVWTYTYLVLLT